MAVGKVCEPGLEHMTSGGESEGLKSRSNRGYSAHHKTAARRDPGRWIGAVELCYSYRIMWLMFENMKYLFILLCSRNIEWWFKYMVVSIIYSTYVRSTSIIAIPLFIPSWSTYSWLISLSYIFSVSSSESKLNSHHVEQQRESQLTRYHDQRLPLCLQRHSQ